MKVRFIVELIKNSHKIKLAFDLLDAVLKLADSLDKKANPNTALFARQMFRLLPANFKHPVGTATEQEFIDAVYNLFALFVPSQKPVK